jgi:DNA gyrase subunit A
MPENVEPISLSTETKRRYLNYALSVIQSRALPDVRDGLKPVQRRILYAMFREGYRADDRTRKCTGVVGEVCKSYHPHGTGPVYDALVRMAQDFTLRYPLVYGEGNFGNVDGDPPAAERYTECRLTQIAEQMMGELGMDTVDFRPNFDGEKTEPIVLPAQYPNLLANGAVGIAVGMATNIPPHNIGELIKACLILIDHDEKEPIRIGKLVSKPKGPIRGPDFPLGGKIITDARSISEIYETGQGTIRVQAEWKVEEPTGKKGTRPCRRIIINSIPYGLEKNRILAEMGAIVSERKLPLVTDMVDESSLDFGIRIAIDLKDGADPGAVMAYFFKHTKLQDSVPCNFTCLVPVHRIEHAADAKERTVVELKPERVGLIEMLQHFLDFRLETVRRRYEYILAQLRKRIHILEGFRIIFNALDEALKIIRESTGRQHAAEGLRNRFKLDEEQSLAVVDINLYKIGQLEIKKIIDELREKKKQAKEIETLLASEAALWGEVRRELAEFGEKFGDKRKTKMSEEDEQTQFVEEAYIVRENTNVVLTRDGWIKRVGRINSVATTRVREGDEVIAVVPGSTLDFVVFLSSDGFAYTMRIDAVPASSGYGEPAAKFFKLRDGATIVATFTCDPRFTPMAVRVTTKKPPYFAKAGEWQLTAATSAGLVNRMPLTPFMEESTKAGRRYIRLKPGEQVVLAAVPSVGNETMFLCSDDGRLIHFPIEEIPLITGVGKGVRGIRLMKNAKCLGGAVVGEDLDRVTIQTRQGAENEYRAVKYEPVSRGGKGYEVVKRGGFKKVVRPEIQLVDWTQFEG